MLAAFAMLQVSELAGKWISGILKSKQATLYSLGIFVVISFLAVFPQTLLAIGRIQAAQEKNTDRLLEEWIRSNVSSQERHLVVIEGVNNSPIVKIARQHGFTFVDVERERAFLNSGHLTTAKYLVIVKDASKSLYCYPLPVYGSVEKGDLICDIDALQDSKAASALRASGFTLVTTLERNGYSGLNLQVYRRQ